MLTKKYKIRPCKIINYNTGVFRNESLFITSESCEQFLNDVICYNDDNLGMMFDLPQGHKHWKDFWLINDVSDCYEVKE